jgi:hypothetical protein
MKRSDCSATQKDRHTKKLFLFSSLSRTTDAEESEAAEFCFCCISINRPGASAFKGLSVAERKTGFVLGAPWSANRLREIRAVQAEGEAAFYLVHHVVLVGTAKKLLLPGLGAGVLCSRWSTEQKQKH